jgi:hypothetical protein
MARRSSAPEEAALSKLKYWSKNARPDKITTKFEKSYLVDQDVELSKDVADVKGEFVPVVKVKILSKSYDVEWVVDAASAQTSCSFSWSSNRTGKSTKRHIGRSSKTNSRLVEK